MVRRGASQWRRAERAAKRCYSHTGAAKRAFSRWKPARALYERYNGTRRERGRCVADLTDQPTIQTARPQHMCGDKQCPAADSPRRQQRLGLNSAPAGQPRLASSVPGTGGCESPRALGARGKDSPSRVVGLPSCRDAACPLGACQTGRVGAEACGHRGPRV